MARKQTTYWLCLCFLACLSAPATAQNLDSLDNTTLEGYNNFFNLKTFGLSLGYRLSETWRIQARTAYDDRHFSARFFYTASPLDKSVETARNWWNQMQVSRTGRNSSTGFRLAYRNGTDQLSCKSQYSSPKSQMGILLPTLKSQSSAMMK